MFKLRRVCKPATRFDTWKVAALMKNICSAYEEKGRSPATIYVQGFSTPGDEIAVYAEWDQESIEFNARTNVPDIVIEKYMGELNNIITSNQIEFYEIATSEKLREWTDF